MKKERIEILAAYLETDFDDAESQEDDYLVYNDEEADEACVEYVKESVWAFNACFILMECGLDHSDVAVESLKIMQEKSCEGANEFILSLIDKTCGIRKFAFSAMSADGRGHFMNTYDGEEHEHETENDGTFYIYRLN